MGKATLPGITAVSTWCIRGEALCQDREPKSSHGHYAVPAVAQPQPDVMFVNLPRVETHGSSLMHKAPGIKSVALKKKIQLYSIIPVYSMTVVGHELIISLEM